MIPCTVSGQILGAAALGEHAHVLLGVQRIAAGALQQRRLRLGFEQRPVAQRRDQLRGLFVGQRRQRDVRRVHLASAPRRSALEQLEPRGAQDQQRHVARPVGEVLDEVEQPVVGPVDVLEDEDERRAPPRAPRRSGATPRTPPPASRAALALTRRAAADARAPTSASSSISCSTAARASPPPRRRCRSRGSRPAPSPSRPAPSS